MAGVPAVLARVQNYLWRRYRARQQLKRIIGGARQSGINRGITCVIQALRQQHLHRLAWKTQQIEQYESNNREWQQGRMAEMMQMYFLSRLSRVTQTLRDLQDTRDRFATQNRVGECLERGYRLKCQVVVRETVAALLRGRETRQTMITLR